jgi:hypothetical protein
MTNLVQMSTGGKTTILYHRQTLLYHYYHWQTLLYHGQALLGQALLGQALLHPCNFLPTFLQKNHLPCIRSKCP